MKLFRFSLLLCSLLAISCSPGGNVTAPVTINKSVVGGDVKPSVTTGKGGDPSVNIEVKVDPQLFEKVFPGQEMPHQLSKVQQEEIDQYCDKNPQKCR